MNICLLALYSLFQFTMGKQKPLDMRVVFKAVVELFDRVTKRVKYSEERMEKMYSYPASIDLALIHKNANQFGHIPNSSNRQQAKICPCCQLPINTEQNINLSYHTLPKSEKNYYLNAGTSMFFTFIKMAIIYLTLRFIITDGFNLITNILAKTCQNPSYRDFCSRSIFARLSTFNKSTDTDQVYLLIVDILNMVTVVLSIIFFTAYRKIQLTIFHFASLLNRSQADYTIFVEQIPILKLNSDNKQDKALSEQNIKTRLQTFFQTKITAWFEEIDDKKQSQYFKTKRKYNKLQSDMEEVFKYYFNFKESQKTKVTSISLCYDITQLEQINNKRQELMKKYKADRQKNKLNEQNYDTIRSQIKELNNQIIQISIRYAKQSTLQTNNSHFLGKAFISFQYQHYRQYFLEYFSFNDSDKQFKISPAAQPSDVYWYNMKVSTGQRRWSIFFSFFIMTILLILSCGLLILLQYYKIKISNESSTKQEQKKTTFQIIKGYALTVTMTVATIGINHGLGLAINMLTTFQKHMTKTDEIISLIVKTVIAQFLNTAIIYYILSLIANFLLANHIELYFDDGLVVNISSLIVISGAIQIFTNLVQFGEIFGCLCNCCKYSKEKTVNLFQIELNKELQPTEFSFAMRYAYYILNVFVVSFYSYIVPYTSLILIMIFIAQYWVDKYNLFKRFSCPTNFNYRLSIFTLKIFECSIFFFALGNLLFAPTIHTNSRGSGYSVINIISLILAFAYCLAIFIVPKKWLQVFNSIQIDHTSYEKCKSFLKTYKIQNPATTFTNEYNQQAKFASASDLQLIKEYEHRDLNHTAQTLNKNQPHSNEQMKDSQLPVKERRDL